MDISEMLSVYEKSLNGPDTGHEKEEEKTSSSGYDTLSGQTTGYGVQKLRKNVIDNVIYNGSTSEDELCNDHTKNLKARKKKPRHARRLPADRDVLEADVDSDTTVESNNIMPRDKYSGRKPIKKKFTKQVPQNINLHPRMNCHLIKSSSGDSAMCQKKEIFHEYKSNMSNERINPDYSDKSHNPDPLMVQTSSDSETEPRSKEDKKEGLVPIVTLSWGDFSENNSTVGYPSDTISSESSFASNIFKANNYGGDTGNDVLSIESESGAKNLAPSLASSCTTSTRKGEPEGRTTAVPEKNSPCFFPYKSRPDSLQSYEQLIEKIDRKLKQTESLRTAQENESLKADLRSIQEQLTAIKLSSGNSSVSGETSTDVEGCKLAEKQIINPTHSTASPITSTNSEMWKYPPADLQDEVLSNKYDKNHNQYLFIESNNEIQNRISCGHKGIKSQQNKASVEDVKPHCEYKGDHTLIHPRYSDNRFLDEYAQQNEIFGLPCPPSHFQRRQSDPTGLNRRFLEQLHDNSSKKNHALPDSDVNSKDVWFGLFGRTTNVTHNRTTHESLVKGHKCLIPRRPELQSTPHVTFVRSHCRSSTRSDSRDCSYSRSYTIDEIDNSFVYPYNSALIEQPSVNTSHPVERRERAARIRYVDNYEQQAIMESLSSTSKRKKTDAHNTLAEKHPKKSKPSLIKRVKAGFRVRHAFSKLKPHKSERAKKLELSYTSQWVGVGSSGDEDPRESATSSNDVIPNLDNQVKWMNYRDGEDDDIQTDPDFDPLAHLESGRSQRRGSIIKRLKNWYNSRSKSTENVSSLDKIQGRFEILNISDSPRRLGSNGPLVNNVIKNRSRSEEHLPTYYEPKLYSSPEYTDKDSCGNGNVHLIRTESSQSLVDTKVVRFADTVLADSPIDSSQCSRIIHMSQGRMENFVNTTGGQTTLPSYLYRPGSPHNCPYCYSNPVPPVRNFHCCNYLQCHDGGMNGHFDKQFDNLGCQCVRLPVPRRLTRARASKPLSSERVVPPLEMTVTHEKTAETRKLTVQHTFV